MPHDARWDALLNELREVDAQIAALLPGKPFPPWDGVSFWRYLFGQWFSPAFRAEWAAAAPAQRARAQADIAESRARRAEFDRLRERRRGIVAQLRDTPPRR